MPITEYNKEFDLEQERTKFIQVRRARSNNYDAHNVGISLKVNLNNWSSDPSRAYLLNAHR